MKPFDTQNFNTASKCCFFLAGWPTGYKCWG